MEQGFGVGVAVRFGSGGMLTAPAEAGNVLRCSGVAENVSALTAAEMRDADAAAVASGIPERLLMENAARAAAAVLHRLYPRGPVVAVVGGGNNGGDAVVLLRTLQAWGREVAAVVAPGATMPAELLHAHAIAVVPPGEITLRLAGAAVVVDGLLGTGARGAPRTPYAELIEQINASGRPALSLDSPSGVDLTDGSASGAAVCAAATVTFGAPKTGLLLFPGRRLAGRILVVEVGFPRFSAAAAAVITPAWAAARLPAVAANAHKGTLGTITVLAGDVGVAGAAVLVATGALRAGAGKVRIVSAAANRDIMQTAVPEALFVDRDSTAVEEAFYDADAVVAGPGMGTSEAAKALLRRVLAAGEAPLLLDADALTLLAQSPDLLGVAAARPVLLTPHPGEMARLMDSDTDAIVADPFGFARKAVERFGCVVLLKGHPSLVAAPGEPVLVNIAGHSGLATGGMGDTLAGIAGAFLAVGAAPRVAAALALAYGGRAAELAGRGRSLLPRDVARELPRALAEPVLPSSLRLPQVLLDIPPAV